MWAKSLLELALVVEKVVAFPPSALKSAEMNSFIEFL